MLKNPFRHKKKKFVLIFILSVLLLSPSVNSSSVGPSSEVEVKAGESYNWGLKFNISNYIEILINTAGTVSTELLALNLQGDSDGLITLTAKLQIVNISDGFVIDSFFDVTFTIVEAEFTLDPEYNITMIPIFYPLNFSIKHSLTRTNFSVLKGDTSDYFSLPIGFFLIVPTDLDWTLAATELQSYFRRNFVASNYTVSPQENGLKMAQPADTTILASELNLNYNSKGVLETADGSYNGALLFSLELSSDGTIAFELPLFLIISTIAITILIRRRKKRITLK